MSAQGVLRTITTRLHVEEDQNARKAVQGLTTEFKTLESQMALLDNQYKDTADSAEALTVKSEKLAEMYEKKREIIQELDRAYNNANANQFAFAKQVEESQGKIEKINAQLAQLKNSTGDTSKQEAELTEQLKKAQKELTEAEKGYEKASKSVNDWEQKTNKAKIELNNLDRELTATTKSLLELQEGTADSADTMQDFSGQVEKADAAMLSSAVAAAGLIKLTDNLKESLEACARAAMDFETGMAKVKTLLPQMSNDDLGVMSEQMRQFAQTMNVLSTEAVPALYQAISASVPEETVFDFLQQAQMAAIGGATTLGTAVDGLTTIINSYGQANMDANTASDMLFEAMRLGKTDFEELSSSAYRVVVNAAGMEVGFNNVAAGMAVLTAQGTPTRVAGTQLNSMFLELGDTTSDVGRIFQKLAGQSFQDFMGAGGDMLQVLQLLENYADSSGQSLGQLFSSQVAGQAAMGLTGTQAEMTANALDVMANSAGATERAYNTMVNTTGYSAQRLTVSAEALQLAIGEGLLPVMDKLANVGANALDWITEFVEKNPEVVRAMAGMTAALGVLTVGLGATALASKYAKNAITAFNAALLANPYTMAATAIVALTAAVVGLMVAYQNTKTEAQEFTEALAASREAYQENINAIQEQDTSTNAMIASLQALTTQEQKTAQDKAVILGIVENLNEALPDLNLYYDEQTDALYRLHEQAVLTADALFALIYENTQQETEKARIDRITGIYGEWFESLNMIEQKELELAEAESAMAAARELGTGQFADAAIAVGQLQGEIETLQDDLIKLNDEYLVLNEGQEGVTSSLWQMTDALEAANNAVTDDTEAAKNLTIHLAVLAAQTQELIAGEDDLSRAYKEQQEAGNLSLDTVLALIDAGQAELLLVDDLTGAISLNTDAYLEKQRQELEAQAMALLYATATEGTANALMEEAESALVAAQMLLTHAEMQSLATDEQKSYAAQIAAIAAALQNLGSSASGAARASGSATRSARKATDAAAEQAKEDLATYKDLKAELDHQKAMDLIDEEHYYNKLREYRDEYLASAENLDAFRNASESLYGYQRKLVDDLLNDQLDKYDKHLNNLADAAGKTLDEIQSRYDEVLRKQENMTQKLLGYITLFEDVEDRDGKKVGIKLTDLEAELAMLNQYDDTLSELREKGISESLLAYVADMSVDDALAYGELLLKEAQDPAKWQAYNDNWEEYRRRAEETSVNYYKDEREALEDEWETAFEGFMASLADVTFESGLEAMDNLIEGMESREAAVYLKAQEIVDNMAEIFASAYSPLPAGAAVPVSGSHAGGLYRVPYDGYVAELHADERVLTASEARALEATNTPSFQWSDPVAGQNQQLVANMVNAVSTLLTGLHVSQRNNYRDSGDVVLHLDGVELARVNQANTRRVNAQSPEIRSDF